MPRDRARWAAAALALPLDATGVAGFLNNSAHTDPNIHGPYTPLS